MINNFYSTISNGNLVDKCSHKQHHVPEQPYLLKNKFLSEFRTALEKAKVRANLGIADSETLFWGNIQGDISEQQDISKYINSLLALDYSIENNFDAGDNFQNIKNVRDAAITCLDYLSRFKGEGAEIQALDRKIKDILKNLYAVDNLDDVSSSQGGVINELTAAVESLQQSLGNPEATVEEIEERLIQVEEGVSEINEVLQDINNLLVVYKPTDGTQNALQIIEDEEIEQNGEIITRKGGLYVKDLQPQIDELNDEINGDSGKISVLQKDIQKNAEDISTNKDSIDNLQTQKIPSIDKEIADIKRDYVSKESLGSSSPIVTDDKLQQKLNNYVKTDSTARLAGITSNNDTINVDKPFNFTTNDPGDSRRYVAKKEDLLKITNYWPGMEVIVIEDALMYILKKDGDPTDPTYNGWKIADNLKIEVLSIDEFEERQKAGELNPLVYYYIYSDPITFKEYPKREDYSSEEDFKYAEELWRKDTYILQNQYMSAAWGQDLDNRIKGKVDNANFTTALNRIAVIEAFFNSKEGDTLSSLKESIQHIYRPAYTETDNSGHVTEFPESGLLVTLTAKVNELDQRVEDLENADFVKWSDIGAGNEIVTDPELTNRLERYVEKDTKASVEGLTSQNDVITLDKPLSMQSNKPLDARRYVEKYSDIFSIDPAKAFEGMEVIVKSEGFIMMLQDIDNITREIGWKNVGLASIVELPLEEYKLRADNTNDDGSSKGHLYPNGEEIPTLHQNVYYFITETPITFTQIPERGDRTDEEWIADLETWKKNTYQLWHMFLTASWGEDMTAKVNNKVDQATFDVTKRIADDNKEAVIDIYNQLGILNAYFENALDVKIEDVVAAAEQLRSDFDALSEDHNLVKLDLYGNAYTKPKFVTWAALGGEGDDALDEGKTLFVKTDIYEADRLTDSKEFTTEKLTFPGTTTIHHDAVEEVSHIDESTGEKVVDVEAQEAYDEEVHNPLSITRKENRIKVGDEEVAFKEDLLKSIEFDSYPIYFEWIQGRGTIDGNPGSQTYSEWIEGKNLEDWYFLIKYDGTVLPPKNEGETQEQYEARLEPFKKGMLVTAYDAENIFATKGALQAAVDTLTAKVNYENMRVDKVKEQLAEGIQGQNDHINQIEENLTETCKQQREENVQLNQKTLDTFYKAWGRFYNKETGIITDLGTVIDISEETLTTNITNVLKEFTTSEVERVAAEKLEESLFKEIWDTYYIANEEGATVYTPLKDILAAIIGTGEDGDSLSLASLNAQINLRETIADHNADIAEVRSELATAVEEVKEYSDTNKNIAIDKCLNSVPITYKELKNLRDSGELVEGRNYRIIDYITTSKDTTTKVIWHPFDIIVTATKNNELSETAYAAQHHFTEGESEDLYYKNSNLTAWELRYILDNDDTRYSWIDDRYIVVEGWQGHPVDEIIPKNTWETLSEPNQNKCEQIGKGIIYYMKDEFNNECAYDFKSILFERYYIQQLENSKVLVEWVINKYYSAISSTIESIRAFAPFYKSLNGEGDQTKFYYTYTLDSDEPVELTVYNANNGLNTCRDNHFAYPCNFYNVMYDGVELILDKNRIVLNNNVFIGSEFVSNTCNQQGFAFNTILNGASFNTFGANFAFNIIGQTFTNNIFQNDCKRNVINARFKYNTTGNKFIDNCISTDSENNTFKELFVNNALEAHTTENIFGNNIKTSEFPKYFKNNELGGDTTQLKIYDTAKYMQFCYFNKGIYQLDIVDSKERSNQNSWYQYIHFNWCAYSNTKTIDLCNGDFQGTGNNFAISPGNKYIVEIQNSTIEGLGYVWCPADVIAFVNQLNKKVESLEKNLALLSERVTKTEQDIVDINTKFTAEQAYTDSIVNELTKLASNTGFSITLERPNNNL